MSYNPDDYNSIFNILPDFWQKTFEDKDALKRIWSGYGQAVGDLFWQLSQTARSISLPIAPYVWETFHERLPLNNSTLVEYNVETKTFKYKIDSEIIKLGILTDTVNPDNASFAMEEGVDYRLIRDDKGDCFLEIGNRWIYKVAIAHTGDIDIPKGTIVQYHEEIAVLTLNAAIYKDYVEGHYERLDFDVPISEDFTGHEFDYIVKDPSGHLTIGGFEPSKIELTKSKKVGHVKISVFWKDLLPSNMISIPTGSLYVYRSYDYEFIEDIKNTTNGSPTAATLLARQIGDQYRKLISTFDTLPEGVTEIKVSAIKTDSILNSHSPKPLPPVLYADRIFKDKKIIEANFGRSIDYGNIRRAEDQRILTFALDNPQWLNQEYGKDYITFGGMELARGSKDKIVGVQLDSDRELRQLELYKLRVNALWFALWNGPSQLDLNIGASIFLGLPISELYGNVVATSANEAVGTVQYRDISDGARTIRYTLPNGIYFDEKFYLGAEVTLFEPLARNAADVYDININEQKFENTLVGLYDAFISVRGSERSLLFDLDDLFFDMNPPCEQLFFDAKDDCDPGYVIMTTSEYNAKYPRDLDVVNGTFYFDESKVTPCCSYRENSEFPENFYQNFRYLFVADILGGVEYEYENFQGLSDFLTRIKPTYANFILNRNVPTTEKLGFNDLLRLVRPQCDKYSERQVFADENEDNLEYFDEDETTCSCGTPFDSGEGFEKLTDVVEGCGWELIGNADIDNRTGLPSDLEFIETYPTGFATTVLGVTSKTELTIVDTPSVDLPSLAVMQVVSGVISGLCIQIDSNSGNDLTLKYPFHLREIIPGTEVVIWLDAAADVFEALDDKINFAETCTPLDFQTVGTGDNPDVVTVGATGGDGDYTPADPTIAATDNGAV